MIARRSPKYLVMVLVYNSERTMQALVVRPPVWAGLGARAARRIAAEVGAFLTR